MKTKLYTLAANVFYGIRSLIAYPAYRTKRKIQSLANSQGIPKFSGSGYNGPGNVNSGKKRYNKKRR